MLKHSTLIYSLVQQLDMAAFPLHLTSISKVSNGLTNMPQKSSLKFSYNLSGQVNILLSQHVYV